MEKLKKILQKGKLTIASVWGRKELWIDGVLIFLIVIVMTGLPQIYSQISSNVGRIVLAFVFLIILASLSIYLSARIIGRNRNGRMKGKDCLRLILRILAVLIGIWIFACVMVKTAHPSLSGIYVIELSRGKKNLIRILNSLSFVLISQALITSLTGTEEKAGKFLSRLAKTWLLTILPMFCLSYIFTILTEWMETNHMSFAMVITVLSTAFLWVTTIALNERIKGEG